MSDRQKEALAVELSAGGWLEVLAGVGSVSLFAFLVGLFIVASVSILRSSHLSPLTKFAWVAACFAIPLVLPGIWLLYGEKDAREWAGRLAVTAEPPPDDPERSGSRKQG